MEGEKDSLVRQHTPLVASIARKFMGRGVDYDDLFQLGSIGLIKAIDGFDEGMGTQFSTYAVPKIMGEIRRFLRDDGAVKVSRSVKEKALVIARARERIMSELGEEPSLSLIAIETGIPADEIALCEGVSLPAESLDRPLGEEGGSLLELKGDGGIEEGLVESIDLRYALDTLDELTRQVIFLRYYKGFTQQKTGEVLGLRQVRVSRLERKALGLLRDRISLQHI